MSSGAGTRTRAAAAARERGDEEDPFRVLVAGAGIGGLEAILALREISGAEISIELLSPVESYSLVPLSVLEPFGGAAPREVPLAEFCDEQGVEFTRGGLSEVWPGQQRVLTDDGAELYYDALLLSIGARRRPLIEGAINFRGSADVGAIEQLVDLGRTKGGRIAIAIPAAIDWTLPLYELALLLADRLREASVEIEILTYERRALEVFGPSASALVAQLLSGAGVTLRVGVEDPALAAEELDPARVVSLPKPFVVDIPGLPQLGDGFIPVDAGMEVVGAERVWAVGDVTWSPIKQGGLAAQQADVAAAAIAAAAGAAVEVPAYAPVLRAALMTAEGPYYLRSGTPDDDGELRAPLWWPPAKVAGRLLAPYLSRRIDPLVHETELLDMRVEESRDADHREAHELALRWADLDAESGDLRRALHWLDVAEGLELALPEEYETKRGEWRRRLGAN